LAAAGVVALPLVLLTALARLVALILLAALTRVLARLAPWAVRRPSFIICHMQELGVLRRG